VFGSRALWDARPGNEQQLRLYYPAPTDGNKTHRNIIVAPRPPSGVQNAGLVTNILYIPGSGVFRWNYFDYQH
jgi:hypothetical protein